MIRKYRDYWGVVLPRGGGVKRFETEKDARTFVLASTLFEDVEWPSDEPEAIDEPQPDVTVIEDEEAREDASDEDLEDD